MLRAMSSTSLPSDIDPVIAATVLQDQSDNLKTLVQHDITNIVSKLYSRYIISGGARSEAMNKMYSASYRTVELLSAVRAAVKQNPHLFAEFVRILESEPCLKSLAEKLVEEYRKATKTQISQAPKQTSLPPPPQGDTGMEHDGPELTATKIQEPTRAADVPSGEPTLPPQTGARVQLARVQLDGQEPTDEADLPGADSASHQAATTPSQPSEVPAHGKDDLHKIAAAERKPITKVLKTQDPTLYSNVQKFREDVEVLVHTVNEYEKWAVYDLLKPPPFAEKPIDLFGPNWIMLGMFGGYKAAMIQTEQGARARRDLKEALKHFPNAKVIMAVGVLYSFDREKCKFGDVIVSDFIDGVANYKFASDGSGIKILVRPSSGRHKPVYRNLVHAFARGAATWGAKGGFKCTKDGRRKSAVYPGEIASGPALVDNKDVRDKLRRNAPEARGGEMEGYVLNEIQEDEACINGRELGVVVIKACADYADGTKAKNWQLTAAMAAAHYAEHKLELTEGKLFVKDGGRSGEDGGRSGEDAESGREGTGGERGDDGDTERVDGGDGVVSGGGDVTGSRREEGEEVERRAAEGERGDEDGEDGIRQRSGGGTGGRSGGAVEGRRGGDPVGGRTGGRMGSGASDVVTGTGTEGVDGSHDSRNGGGAGSRQEVERHQSSTAVNPAQGNNNSWVPVAISAGFFTASLVVLGLAAYRKL